MEALINVQRAAELLGISPWTVRKWLSTNRLRAVRLGDRAVRIEMEEIRRMIDLGRDREPADQGQGAAQ